MCNFSWVTTLELEGITNILWLRRDLVLFSYSGEKSFNPTFSSSLSSRFSFCTFVLAWCECYGSIPPLPGSLHSLTNWLKVDVCASSRVLREFRKLEGKRLSKIKGKRGKWVPALSLQTQCSLKTQSLPRCSRVTTIVVEQRQPFPPCPMKWLLAA